MECPSGNDFVGYTLQFKEGVSVEEVHWRIINTEMVLTALKANETCQKESVRITARYRWTLGNAHAIKGGQLTGESRKGIQNEVGVLELRQEFPRGVKRTGELTLSNPPNRLKII